MIMRFVNSGDYNTGHYNSGDENTGDHNTDNWNSGNCNSGYRNAGYCNSGNWNSGDCNSGDRNSGYYNSGDRNSGNYNSGDWNVGFFNTNEPTVRMFNKDTGKTRYEIDLPYIALPLTEWIPKQDMTQEQKEKYPGYRTVGGCLITRTYKEAWAIVWEKMEQLTRNKFLNLPNFCPDIFEEITGIKVNRAIPGDGKIVEIDGKKYKLTEVK